MILARFTILDQVKIKDEFLKKIRQTRERKGSQQIRSNKKF